MIFERIFRGNSTFFHYNNLILTQIYLGRDEFAPEFNHQSYSFRIKNDYQVGDILGAVYAKDKDAGRDGQVSFCCKILIQ